MKKIKILHRTTYDFSAPVDLGPHLIRVRPREGHKLHIESSILNITPTADVFWQSDVEDNSVATAMFETQTDQLVIESEVVVQQYNESPFDFLTAKYAIDFPFLYVPEDWRLLAPYAEVPLDQDGTLTRWTEEIWTNGEPIQTLSLLLRVAERIKSDFRYQIREEPGVQSPLDTLKLGSGSCRDFAALFIAAARIYGFAARFVSGYLVVPPSDFYYGATHAWAQVYIPGTGWTGFDPTLGVLSGPDHIVVAVARLPDTLPPVEGSFTGAATSSMSVGVWVTPL